MPPVSGSSSVPLVSVIKPVFAFTVALGVDDALVELDALGVELDALLELDELLELLVELEALAVDWVSGWLSLNFAQTLDAVLAHTTRLESEGAVVTGTVWE